MNQSQLEERKRIQKDVNALSLSGLNKKEIFENIQSKFEDKQMLVSVLNVTASKDSRNQFRFLNFILAGLILVKILIQLTNIAAAMNNNTVIFYVIYVLLNTYCLISILKYQRQGYNLINFFSIFFIGRSLMGNSLLHEKIFTCTLNLMIFTASFYLIKKLYTNFSLSDLSTEK